MTTKQGLEFDPGFSPFVLAFRGAVEYLYLDINRFKNLSQKKTKFMQYHKKIIDIFYNNIGFYVGCLMWAAYLKSQPEQDILSNFCYGEKYNEQENISDTEYMLTFTKLFSKDKKYFMGQDFEFEQNIINLINIYKEFLILNKGFTETKTNIDIVLPKSINTKDTDLYKTIIDESIKEGNLTLLKDKIQLIVK